MRYIVKYRAGLWGRRAGWFVYDTHERTWAFPTGYGGRYGWLAATTLADRMNRKARATGDSEAELPNVPIRTPEDAPL